MVYSDPLPAPLVKDINPSSKYKYIVPRGLLPPRQAGPRQLKRVMPQGWGIR
jgi:hypothetical protein